MCTYCGTYCCQAPAPFWFPALAFWLTLPAKVRPLKSRRRSHLINGGRAPLNMRNKRDSKRISSSFLRSRRVRRQYLSSIAGRGSPYNHSERMPASAVLPWPSVWPTTLPAASKVPSAKSEAASLASGSLALSARAQLPQHSVSGTCICSHRSAAR